MHQRLKRQLRGCAQLATSTVFVLYAWLIVTATQVPFEYRFGWRRLLRLPFSFGAGWGPGWAEPLGNLLMFVPFGVLLAVLIGWRLDRPGSRAEGAVAQRQIPGRMIGWVTGVGALFSLLMESLQTFQPQRHPSVVDVVLNTGGAFLGAVVVAVTLRLVRKRSRRGDVPNSN